jgi:hypothetical protein
LQIYFKIPFENISFKNSLIIHDGKTKEITAVYVIKNRGGGGCAPLALARGGAGGAIFYDKAKNY